jgi:hypothetical protein
MVIFAIPPMPIALLSLEARTRRPLKNRPERGLAAGPLHGDQSVTECRQGTTRAPDAWNYYQAVCCCRSR